MLSLPSDKFSMTLDYNPFCLVEGLSLYYDHVAKSKWASRVHAQMKVKIFDPMEPFRYLGSSTDSKWAVMIMVFMNDSLFLYFVKKSAGAALTAHLSI